MTAPAAARAFDTHARDYDALRRRLVPDFDGLYGVLVAVLRHTAGSVARVLDLGAGTGLVAEHVLRAVPEARLELLDASEPMLDLARQRLGQGVAAVHVADLAAPLPDGPFDAIVSGLAIHHLEHADQRALLSRVHRALRPGGVFIDLEQVQAPTPDLQAVYERQWDADCRGLGASEAELDAARERMRHDRCATTEQLLAWLIEAGFTDTDCAYKRWRFAVVAGWRHG